MPSGKNKSGNKSGKEQNTPKRKTISPLVGLLSAIRRTPAYAA